MHLDIIEYFLIVGSILTLSFGAKFLIWGRGPLWRRGLRPGDQAHLAQLAELEERLESQLTEYVTHHDRRLAELEERVDFAERLLTSRSQGDPETQAESKVRTPV